MDILLSEMLQSSLREHKMHSCELFEATEWNGTVAVSSEIFSRVCC